MHQQRRVSGGQASSSSRCSPAAGRRLTTRSQWCNNATRLGGGLPITAARRNRTTLEAATLCCPPSPCPPMEQREDQTAADRLEDDLLEALEPSHWAWLHDASEEASHADLFDVLGIAQSMVDITTETSVDDELLQRLGVEKGGRRVLGSADERSTALQTLEDAGTATKVTPGGSLANTLVAIARLSAAATAAASASASSSRSLPPAASPRPRRRATQLNVALGAPCSPDALGEFFSSQLCSAGVTVLPTAPPPSSPSSPASPSSSASLGHTGTVFVLASPDAQRSFLSFFTSEPLALSPRLRSAVARSRLVVVEGYLWELPDAAATIADVLATARAGNAQVALTAGDAGVVARNREAILQVLQSGGHDVLFFANHEEACELVGACPLSCCSARESAVALAALCSVAVVTDGPLGSFVAWDYGRGVVSVPPALPPHGASAKAWVKDTCGAGDAFAAGFCFALMLGHGYGVAGAFASKAAMRVIGRHGAQLTEDEAGELVAELPERPASRWYHHRSQQQGL